MMKTLSPTLLVALISAPAFAQTGQASGTTINAYDQRGTALVEKASLTSTGAMVPVEEIAEAHPKHLERKPTGPFAKAADAMTESLSTSVETAFQE